MHCVRVLQGVADKPCMWGINILCMILTLKKTPTMHCLELCAQHSSHSQYISLTRTSIGTCMGKQTHEHVHSCRGTL